MIIIQQPHCTFDVNVRTEATWCSKLGPDRIDPDRKVASGRACLPGLDRSEAPPGRATYERVLEWSTHPVCAPACLKITTVAGRWMPAIRTLKKTNKEVIIDMSSVVVTPDSGIQLMIMVGAAFVLIGIRPDLGIGMLMLGVFFWLVYNVINVTRQF